MFMVEFDGLNKLLDTLRIPAIVFEEKLHIECRTIDIGSIRIVVVADVWDHFFHGILQFLILLHKFLHQYQQFG
jgi:hypothetical protein